jgi:hypothetical protein
MPDYPSCVTHESVTRHTCALLSLEHQSIRHTLQVAGALGHRRHGRFLRARFVVVHEARVGPAHSASLFRPANGIPHCGPTASTVVRAAGAVGGVLLQADSGGPGVG